MYTDAKNVHAYQLTYLLTEEQDIDLAEITDRFNHKFGTTLTKQQMFDTIMTAGTRLDVVERLTAWKISSKSL